MTKLSDLKKLTAVKLREMAAQFEEIQGASGMHKDQLVRVVADAMKKRGQLQEEMIHSEELDQMEKDRLKFKPEMKALIREKQSLLARPDHDLAKLKNIRQRMKWLRRRIHRIHVREQHIQKLLKMKK